MTAEQVRQAIPGLGGARSRGYRYYECQTDDARLTIEVARAAQAFGAVLANHVRAEALLGGARVEGAVAADKITGQRFEIRARVTVNAAGVWADQVTSLAAAGAAARLQPSKGVHLVFAPGAVRTKAALAVPSAAGDGRFMSSSSRGRTGSTPGRPTPPIRATWIARPWRTPTATTSWPRWPGTSRT